MVSRFIASWMVFTGEVDITKVTFGVGASRPIQLNCADLKRTLDAPSRSSSGAVGTIRPSTVPSFGATLKMWLAATSEPPPGMLRATTFGWPGMYLPIWRETARA